MLLIEILLITTTLTNSAAIPPELQSAVLSSSSNYFDHSATYLVCNKEEILVGFGTLIDFSFSSGDGLQFHLPPHYTSTTTSISTTGFGCKLEADSGVIAIGTPRQLIIAGSTSIDLRCDFSSSINVPKGPSYRIRFFGVSVTKIQISPSCASSLFLPTPTDILSSILSPLANHASIERSSSGTCCTTSKLSLYLKTACVDFTNIDTDKCALCIRDTPAYDSNNGLECINSGCNSPDYRFVNLSLTASANVQLTVTPLTFRFSTSVALDINLQTKQQTTDVVPAYFWFKLPSHSCSFSDPSDIHSHSVQCALTVNGVAYAGIAAPSSPTTVVRYINSNYVGQGIYVMCSLNGNTIAAGATIEAKITGVKSPAANPTCGSLGVNTSSSYCCDGINVELRKGNSFGSDIAYRSCPCTLCPSWFESQAALEIANANQYIDDLTFFPTGSFPVGTKLQNAHYRFRALKPVVVTTSSVINFDFRVPGVQLTTQVSSSTTPVSSQLRFINTEDSTLQTIPVSVFLVNGALSFQGVLSFSLVGNNIYTVFFPDLITTSSLPSSAQCLSNSFASGSTTDLFCCAEFKFSLSIGSSTITAYAVACPILCGTDPFDPSKDCMDPEPNLNPKCCRPNVYPCLSQHYKEACNLYNCQNPGSPTFNNAECCHLDPYRSSEYCCTGNNFCPQFCCGATDPVTKIRQPFIGDKCCATLPGSDTPFFHIPESNLELWCPCWFELNKCTVTAEKVEICCPRSGDDHSIPSTSPFSRKYHTTCTCEELDAVLQEKLTDKTNMDSFTTIFNQLIAELQLLHPSFSPSQCCELAYKYSPDYDPAVSKKPSPPLSAWLASPFCECWQQGMTTLYSTVPYGDSSIQLNCCEFDVLSPYCPIDCSSPPGGSAACPCGCEEDKCSCCIKGSNDISNVTTGGTQNFDITLQRTKLASDVRVIKEEL